MQAPIVAVLAILAVLSSVCVAQVSLRGLSCIN